MKVELWSSITAGGHPVYCDEPGPTGFLPVFRTKKQAVDFAGSAEHVKQLEPLPTTE